MLEQCCRVMLGMLDGMLRKRQLRRLIYCTYVSKCVFFLEDGTYANVAISLIPQYLICQPLTAAFSLIYTIVYSSEIGSLHYNYKIFAGLQTIESYTTYIVFHVHVVTKGRINSETVDY